MSKDRVLVVVPTYNEKNNVERLCSELLALDHPLDLLFVDDGSPDGTGQILDAIAAEDARVQVMHRSGKLGVGSGHLAGIGWAYDRGYDWLVTMDCDFTHRPAYLPFFLEMGAQSAVVLGSRYMRQQSLDEWNLFRKTLTHVGHLLTRTLLGMPYDATGAYRLYRLSVIPRGLFEQVISMGYSFFFESLYLIHREGLRIKEFPIDLPARTYGESKMRVRDALHSASCLFRIYLRELLPASAKETTARAQLEVRTGEDQAEDWDEYWQTRESKGERLYSVIALFYRDFIIKRALSGVMLGAFQPGSRVLHAGCGGGQVDTDVQESFDVIPLDISVPALLAYRTANPNSRNLVGASILSLPLAERSVDGIYNLGVMEHFTEETIPQILHEFRRVLRDDGKLVLFWPPAFGLSVRALKLIHRVLAVTGNSVTLHPAEVSLVRSREHVERLLQAGGFQVDRYEFGIRDAFTHVIVSAVKAEPLQKDDDAIGVLDGTTSVDVRQAYG